MIEPSPAPAALVLALLSLCAPGAQAQGGLGELATIRPAASKRASSHDPRGNDDNVTSFAPGSTHVMLDTDGPGCIRHIWMTISAFPGHRTILRDLVLRLTWEGSAVPAVEVPLGDFFALGHGRSYAVRSTPVCVGIDPKALNCYWPMPFREHARLELHNGGDRGVRRIYYNIDYELGPVAPDQGLFHALYRRCRELPGQSRKDIDPADNYVLLETEGTGQYVGCVLMVDAVAKGWWGEGDEVIYLDDRERPAIGGTGSEDYFCNAWGFDEVFSFPFYGVPLLETLASGRKLTTAYRWHVLDPVRFERYIKVTLEHLYSEKLSNDYASVAFWYQREPLRSREPLPLGAANHPRFDPLPENTNGKLQIDGTELEPALRAAGAEVLAVTTAYSRSNRGGYLRIDSLPEDCTVALPVDQGGRYRVRLKPFLDFPGPAGRVRFGLEPQRFTEVEKSAQGSRARLLDLGITEAHDGRIVLHLGSEVPFGVDTIELTRVE